MPEVAAAQVLSPVPPSPANSRVFDTYIGYSRTLSYAYESAAATRESHCAYDFVFGFASTAIDFVPAAGIALALPQAACFVSAALITNERDCVAVVHELPRAPDARGYYPLVFTSSAGLYLLACQTTVFTVRVVLCEKPGDTFFVCLQGVSYADAAQREFMCSMPMLETVQWAGAPATDCIRMQNGRLHSQSIAPWYPVQRGAKAYKKFEYNPDIFPVDPMLASIATSYDPDNVLGC